MTTLDHADSVVDVPVTFKPSDGRLWTCRRVRKTECNER
jgi:hypothetical protein